MRISINRAGIINWTKRISPLMMIFMSLDLQAAMTDFAYVINDHLGTARMVVNEAGDVIWPAIGSTESNELLPFGSEIDVYQSESQYNLNFTNKELDRTFDLHYFGARYYQAGIGRFLSIDPVEGKPDDPLSWNRYLYCHNDPINRIDIDGCFSISAEIFYGWGASITFGNNPGTSGTFVIFEGGVGYGGGTSFDPRGEYTNPIENSVSFSSSSFFGFSLGADADIGPINLNLLNGDGGLAVGTADNNDKLKAQYSGNLSWLDLAIRLEKSFSFKATAHGGIKIGHQFKDDKSQNL